jgi:tetratricopeptide (TPR) repeat protein
MALNFSMKTTTTFLFLLLLVSACDSEKVAKDSSKKNDSLAVQLNNSAMERHEEYLLGNTQNADSLKVSLAELDTAIALDSTNTRFYSSKATILLTLNRDKEAIEVLKQAHSVKPNFAEVITTIGFLYDREGEKEVAQKWYQRALDAYDKRIEEGQFVINSKVNKAFLLFFTENRESAIKAYKELKQHYPNNEEVKYAEPLFTDFNKQEFLNELHQ